MRADEGEGAGHDARQRGVLAAGGGAQELPDALALPVGRGCRVQRVGRAGVILRDAGEVRRLPAVNRAGGGEQQPLSAGYPGELQDAAGAGERSPEDFGRGLAHAADVNLRCGVDDGSEGSRRENKVPHVPGVQGDGGMTRKGGGLGGERRGVTRENDDLGAETVEGVAGEKRFQQPATEEARAPSQEQALTAQWLPELVPEKVKDVAEVVGGEVGHGLIQAGGELRAPLRCTVGL